MKKRILTVVIVLAMAFGLSLSALADSNYAEQEQYGGGDSATVEQYGQSNVAYQWQNYYQGLLGGDNIAEIFQEGTGNIASQVQEGIGNEAYITQIGNDNYAGNFDWAGQWQSGGDGWTGIGNYNYSEIWQEGNANRAAQTTVGDDNATVGDDNEAYITQIGNNNDAGFWGISELWGGTDAMFNAGQRQFGNDNIASIYQEGSYNRALQRQNTFETPGDENTAYIEQHGTNSGNSPWGFDVVGAGQKQFGNNNYASIYQNGWENYAYSIQTGNWNTVFQSQTGEYNYGIATQTGDGNSISQDQDGNYNRSIATQTGDGNWISQSQAGNWNYSIVTQTGNGNAATVTQGNL